VAEPTDGWRDISVALQPETPPWPGDTPMSCGWSLAMADGASVNVSAWTLSPHVGTHADAPLHVQRDGAGADALPLAPFRGKAFVADVTALVGEISRAQLAALGLPAGVQRLLLRTDRTTAAAEFPDAWPALSVDAARALVADGLVLLGVDCPSVDDRESKSLAVHHALFDGGAYVLENLDLHDVPPGAYELLALPLKVGAVDAAPARALLRPLLQSRGGSADSPAMP
jgi:arylformamidase